MSFELITVRDSYIRLTFNEANIILENIKAPNFHTLLTRIKGLQDHAADESLREDAKVLFWKLCQMTDEDYTRLCEAAQQGLLLFPGNYLLTKPY